MSDPSDRPIPRRRRVHRASFVAIAGTAAVIAGAAASGCGTSNPAPPERDSGSECQEDAGCDSP